MELDLLEDIFKKMNLKELKKTKLMLNKFYKEKKEEESKNRLIDSYTNQFGVYFRLEKVFCNKKNCSKCKDSNIGHGPYWYSYKKRKKESILVREIRKNLILLEVFPL